MRKCLQYEVIDGGRRPLFLIGEPVPYIAERMPNEMAVKVERTQTLADFNSVENQRGGYKRFRSLRDDFSRVMVQNEV